MRLRLSLAVMLLGALGAPAVISSGLAGAAAAAEPEPGATPRDGSHDMDFGAGRWRTDVTIFKDPFGDRGATVRMAGTKSVTPVWNGKAWLEEIEADGPSGHWQAANLFTYDPKARQWINYFVDSSDGHFGTAHVGEYRDGQIEFYWQDLIGGRTVLVRGVWKDFTPNSHVYEVARSADGGRSWHVSFIARVTRAQ